MHSSRHSKKPSISLHEGTLCAAVEQIERVRLNNGPRMIPEGFNPVIFAEDDDIEDFSNSGILDQGIMLNNRQMYRDFDAIDCIPEDAMASTSTLSQYCSVTQSAPDTLISVDPDTKKNNSKTVVVVEPEQQPEVKKPNVCCGVTMMFVSFFTWIVGLCHPKRAGIKKAPSSNDGSQLLGPNGLQQQLPVLQEQEVTDYDTFDDKSEDSIDSDKTTVNGRRCKST